MERAGTITYIICQELGGSHVLGVRKTSEMSSWKQMRGNVISSRQNPPLGSEETPQWPWDSFFLRVVLPCPAPESPPITRFLHLRSFHEDGDLAHSHPCWLDECMARGRSLEVACLVPRLQACVCSCQLGLPGDQARQAG